MLEQDGYCVVASSHACSRAQARLPHLHAARHVEARHWLEVTAAEAMHEGRKARRLPRWAVADVYGEAQLRTRLPHEGQWRFVWDGEETVALLCKYTRDLYWDERRYLWLIVTTLARGWVVAG